MVAERFATARTLQQALIVSSSIARTFDIEAAKSAAKHFADVLTPAINLGLVEFAANATLLVAPTTNRAAMKAAIDKLQPADRTATGEGSFTALQAIATVGAVMGGIGRYKPNAPVFIDINRYDPGCPGRRPTSSAATGARWVPTFSSGRTSSRRSSTRRWSITR